MLLLSAFLVKIILFRIFIGFVMIYLYYYFIYKIKTKRAGNKVKLYYEETDEKSIKDSIVHNRESSV